MGTLHLTPFDTTLTGPVRRRVWAAPDVRSHSLIVLTLTRLHLVPLTNAPPHPEVVSDLEQGGDGVGILQNRATVLDLQTVRHVRLDLLTDTLTIEHETDGTPGIATIVLNHPEAADELFAKLRHRMDDQFTMTHHTPDPWSALRGPLTVMAGVLIGTGLVAFSLAANASSVDWQWACGIGGILFAALQVWLYHRWLNPSAVLELVPVASPRAESRVRV